MCGHGEVVTEVLISVEAHIIWHSILCYRIVGLPPVFTKQALLNRQNPKVYSAFANILDEKVIPYSYPLIDYSY